MTDIAQISVIVDDDAALRDVANIDTFVLDDMTLTMYRAVNVAEAAIVQRWPVGATGLSRQAWGTAVERGVNAVKGTISNPLDYALFVEKGRGPGKPPPIAPIELWVRRVLAIPEPESRRVAFLVARAIGRRGTKGAAAVEKGIAAVKGLIEADFRNIPARVKARVDAT
jgi:hypothetical protein